jgi:hypothetical protein
MLAVAFIPHQMFMSCLLRFYFAPNFVQSRENDVPLVITGLNDRRQAQAGMVRHEKPCRTKGQGRPDNHRTVPLAGSGLMALRPGK